MLFYRHLLKPDNMLYYRHLLKSDNMLYYRHLLKSNNMLYYTHLPKTFCILVCIHIIQIKKAHESERVITFDMNLYFLICLIYLKTPYCYIIA